MAFLNNSDTPIFVQNQILRADDLNDMVKYFEEQTRLTRIFTIGIGILKGLHVAFNYSNLVLDNIEISAGVGISSDGILFEIDTACNFKFFKSDKISDKAFKCGDDRQRGTCAVENEEGTTIYELFETTGPDLSPVSELVNESLANHCLVFVQCEQTVSRKSCFNDCEEKGADRLTQIRVMFVPESIFGTTDDPNDTNDDAGLVELDPPPLIERFGYTGSALDLCAITDWTVFYENYRNRCVTATSDIVNAYLKAFTGFYAKTVQSPGSNHFNDLANQLNNLLAQYPLTPPSPDTLDIQYCYSFFRDLTLAYEEFFRIACGMSVGINVSTGEDDFDIRCQFPGYISLGGYHINAANIASLDESLCRSGFFPAAATQGSDFRLQQATMLYNRLLDILRTNIESSLDVKLTNQILKRQEIRITGSCTQKFKLSHQAIPYYFRLNNLMNNWNADNPNCAGIKDSITNYEISAGDSNILLNKVDTFDFYRIEGHLDSVLETAIELIKESQKDLNLAFDIRPLLLAPEVSLEEIFAESKPLYWGEIQEVYQNTRSDIMCKIDEWRAENDSFADLDEVYNILLAFVELYIEPNLFPDANFNAVLTNSINNPSVGELGDVLQNAQILFNKLIDKFNNAIADIKKSLLFHTFAEDHPGMEHLGGVHQGGTFILVYTHQGPDSQSMQKRIVGDFCLPYLCCSNTPVIRNEITDPTLQLMVTNLFCFDNVIDENDGEIEYSVRPVGGSTIITTFTYDTGAEVGTDTTIDENTGADPTLDIGGHLDPDNFDNGVAKVILKYLLGSQQIEETLYFYKRPDTSQLECIKGNKILDSKTCDWLGFAYEFKHNLIVDDTESASWTIEDETDPIDLNSNSRPHNYLIDEENNSLPDPVVTLRAENGICTDFTEKAIDFCPPEINFTINQCEPFDEPNNPDPLSSISCPVPIQPEPDPSGLDKYIIMQGDGPGYIEILPDCIRGNLSIVGPTVLGQDGSPLNPNNFIMRRCITNEDGELQASFLFIYNAGLIDPDVLGNLNINPNTQLPGLEETIQFNIGANLNPCPATGEFIFEISPQARITIEEKICFEEDMVPHPYTVEPSGGMISYGINTQTPILHTDNAATNQTLDLASLLDPANDFLNGEATIKILYELGSTIETTVTICKRPEINISIEKVTTIQGDACNVMGYRHRLFHNLIASEVDSAEWKIGSTTIPVNLNDSFIERDFSTDSLPQTIELIAIKGNCGNSGSADIPACPDEINIRVREDCIILGEQEDLMAIICETAVNNNEPVNQHLVSQGEGKGFFELVPDCPGGNFTYTGVLVPPPGPNDPDPVFPSDLIIQRCLPSGNNFVTQYLFIYDRSLIDPAQRVLLGIPESPTLDLGGKIAQFTVTYNYNVEPCNLQKTIGVIVNSASPPGSTDTINSEELSESASISSSASAEKVTSTTKSTEKSIKKPTEKSTKKPKAAKTSKPAKPTKKAMELLNARGAAQREDLNQLEADKALARTKPFGLAKSFLILPANDLSTVNLRFEEVLKSLIASLGRAEGKRKTALNKVTAIAMHNYLDKQTLLSPAAIDPDTMELLENQIPKLKEKKIRLGTIRKSWNGEELKKAFKAKAVDQFNDLLK